MNYSWTNGRLAIPALAGLLVLYHTVWQYFDGNPLTRTSNAGAWKNSWYRPISRFISETIQDRASYYGRRIGNGAQVFEWYPFQMTLNDLERLSEILNNRKHCAVFLRQLSFWFCRPTDGSEGGNVLHHVKGKGSWPGGANIRVICRGGCPEPDLHSHFPRQRRAGRLIEQTGGQ